MLLYIEYGTQPYSNLQVSKNQNEFFWISRKNFFKIQQKKKLLGEKKMKDFTTYLSTAPVLTLVSLTVVAGLLIEINRFFPDALIFAF